MILDYLGLPTDAAVVFLIILVALILFVFEVLPNDVTAILVIVSLAGLERWTQIPPLDAISGFANPATITIIAMYMLSGGIYNTGIVQRLGFHLTKFTKGSEKKSLFATIGTTGPIAGFINNTPVVAIFIPMITELARKNGMSPSKLLLPMSYAAILGGTLTLIGTATNILASDLTDVLLPRGPIGMFEFTSLGIVILAVGLIYLMTLGRYLTPARIPPDIGLAEEFEVEEYLSLVEVNDGSPLIGLTMDEVNTSIEIDVLVLHLKRNGESYSAPMTDVIIEQGDNLTLLAQRKALNRFRDTHDVKLVTSEDATQEILDYEKRDVSLAKMVVPPESAFVGETFEEAMLPERHSTLVLAIKRESEILSIDEKDLSFQPGDTLLVHTSQDSIDHFLETGDLYLISDRTGNRFSEERIDDLAPLSSKTPIGIGVMISVVGLAALNVLPIVIAALAGVAAMIITGCMTPSDAYDSVSWNIIFLLAGVIPLGLALERTGGAEFIADMVLLTSNVLPLIGVLFLLVVLTGLLANVITPVATVVLMIPVAVYAAGELGANEFAFLLGVMFASATSLMTPIGYQTNLMIYGPGGYKFTDFIRVGAPLQFILAVVTTVGVAFIWGF